VNGLGYNSPDSHTQVLPMMNFKINAYPLLLLVFLLVTVICAMSVNIQ
jgi:hypothetical protein